jgi:hypothetical protein
MPFPLEPPKYQIEIKPQEQDPESIDPFLGDPRRLIPVDPQRYEIWIRHRGDVIFHAKGIGEMELNAHELLEFEEALGAL